MLENAPEMSVVQLAKSILAKLENHPKPFVIAVDGFAASGKGTLCRRLADVLGFAYLDTGRLYRAVAWGVLQHNGNPDDVLLGIEAAQKLAENPAMVNEIPAEELRTEAVSNATSKVSRFAEVRQVLLQLQRDFAASPPNGAASDTQKGVKGAILDGRDIGTVVCPDADLKVFVTATPEVRAERRYNEQLAKAVNAEAAGDSVVMPDYAVILADLTERDHRDSSRLDAPLKPALDAFMLDTSVLSPEACLRQVLEVIIQI